ncbi:MAG TPA: hypothetical protein DIU35_13180 [Candidatus Latescibacteria bacterium]|nr:hypothetical protein [Gemmatimonadota bacterium]HCR18427.1 hypothetical protein [Candidatus Latescibacterota bacterium]
MNSWFTNLRSVFRLRSRFRELVSSRGNSIHAPDELDDSHYSPSVYHRYRMENSCASFAFDGGDVRDWQERLRSKLGQLVGEMSDERIPIQARTLWKRDHLFGSIEKVVFSSEPYSDVPAFVCLPGNSTSPYTFFICLQGHSTGMHNSIGVDRDDNTRPIEISGDRDFGLQCMKRGIAALCIEQRAFGERRERIQEKVAPHGCQDAAMHALMLGRTLLGERVFDVDRAIDYLETRGDADMDRIGVMGNSGGGTVSMYAAALLSRIHYAMPSCSFCSFRSSIMSIYHCVDNYIPGLFRSADMSDILGLFAPKPVVIVAGQEDHIFPLSGVQEAYQGLRRIYDACGASSNCHLVVGEKGHRFYAQQAWDTMLNELETPVIPSWS